MSAVDRIAAIRLLASRGLTRAEIGETIGIPGPRVGKIALQNGIFIVMEGGRRGDGLSMFARAAPKPQVRP